MTDPPSVSPAQALDLTIKGRADTNGVVRGLTYRVEIRGVMSDDSAGAKKCTICRMQGNPSGFGHWRWHEFCENELNPVALIQWTDRLPQTPEVRRIRDYIVAVTGMNLTAVDAEIAKDREGALSW